MDINLGEFSAALDMVLFVGGAKAEATPGQFAALQALVPTLKKHIDRGDYEAAKFEVRQVMGADWQPSEEWTLRKE